MKEVLISNVKKTCDGNGTRIINGNGIVQSWVLNKHLWNSRSVQLDFNTWSTASLPIGIRPGRLRLVAWKVWMTHYNMSFVLTFPRQLNSTLRRDLGHSWATFHLQQCDQSPNRTRGSETILSSCGPFICAQCHASRSPRRKSVEIDAQQHCDHDLVCCLLRFLPQYNGFNWKHEPSTFH